MFSRFLRQSGKALAASPLFYSYKWSNGQDERIDHYSIETFPALHKNKPYIIHPNKINVCKTNKEKIKDMLENPETHKMIYGHDQIIIDYDKIESVSQLDGILSNIKDKNRMLVIICNKHSYLDVEEYNERVFECLDKYKDEIKIIYLCRNEQMYPYDD